MQVSRLNNAVSQAASLCMHAILQPSLNDRFHCSCQCALNIVLLPCIPKEEQLQAKKL